MAVDDNEDEEGEGFCFRRKRREVFLDFRAFLMPV